MRTLHLIGNPLSFAVRRDPQALCWRARCFKPAFTLEAPDNRTLVQMIDDRLDEEFEKRPELLEELGLVVDREEAIEGKERLDREARGVKRNRYAVPYSCTKI